MMTHAGDYGVSVAKTAYPTGHPVEPAFERSSVVRFARDEGAIFIQAIGTLACHVSLPIHTTNIHLQGVALSLAKFVDSMQCIVRDTRRVIEAQGGHVDSTSADMETANTEEHDMFSHVRAYLETDRYQILGMWYRIRQIWGSLRPMEEFHALKSVSFSNINLQLIYNTGSN